jgi:phospholipase/carboxylesterase
MQTSHIRPESDPKPGDTPLIMLHGYGSNESDLFSLKSHLPEGYYPIALRGYNTTPYGGYAWYPLYIGPAGEMHVNEHEMIEAAQKLLQDLEDIKSVFGFERPFTLLGFSQGSIMSYLLMSMSPCKFRKIVAFSGYIHDPVMHRLDKEEVKHLQVFASHGIHDDIIPVEWARKIPDRLSQYGIKHIYREYPAGHYLIPENIEDAMNFLAGYG